MRAYKAHFRGKFGVSNFSADSGPWIWDDMPSGAPGERGEGEGSVGSSLKIIGLDTNRQPRTRARLRTIQATSSQWGMA